MRNWTVSAVLAALLAGAPAAAQPYVDPAYPDPVDAEIARSIPSPGEMRAMGNAVGRAADAMMDMPVGNVVNAISPTRRIHPDTRLGEIAGGVDPYARERMHRSIGAMSAGMGEMAGRVAVLAPVLHRSMIDLEARFAEAMRGFPSGGGAYDAPYDYAPDDYGDYYDYDD